MPFDFKAYDAKCANMAADELQREWEHYTRLISGSATSTAVSGVAIPFTLGVSVIGVGLAAPAIHNARKKREIIERHLNRHGTTHNTRKRDVLTPMAISGTVGVVTLGVGSVGADAITNAAAEHGLSSVAANEIAVKATTHLAVDAVAVVGEEHHMKQKKAAEAHNAWLRQQALAGKPVNGVGMPMADLHNPNVIGHQPQYIPGYVVTPPSDIKIGPKISSNSGPISMDSFEPPTPLPPYSPPTSDSNVGYFPLYPQHPQTSFPEKPIFHDASTFAPVSSQSQLTSPGMMNNTVPSCPPTPYQNPSESIKVNTPSVDSNVTTCVSEPPQIAEMPASPVIPKADPQPHQYPQYVYQQPPVHQTVQPMYPSYPGTMIPNAPPQQSENLNQAMHRLSIASLPPPPPMPVASPLPSPRPLSNNTTAPILNNYQAAAPFSPQLTPAPTPQIYSPQPSVEQTHGVQNNFSYFNQPPPSPAMSTVSSLVSPMSPPPMHHFASPMSPPPTNYCVSPPPPASAFAPSHIQMPIQATGFNSYPTPIQTPGPGAPIFSQSPMGNNYSTPPQSYQNFPPPPPSMPGQPMMDSKFGGYGYPTPAATPAPKMDGGMYFPPPPTAPVGGRR